MHRTPFAPVCACMEFSRLAHTSRVGGASLTLHTAVAVNSACPAGPSLEMIVTAAASAAMASRNLPGVALMASMAVYASVPRRKLRQSPLNSSGRVTLQACPP